MNKKVIISTILCIVCVLSLSFKSLAYRVNTEDKINSNNKIDLFKNIIKKTNGKVIEYGVMAEFNSNDSKEKSVNNLFEKVNKNKNLLKKSFCNSESYSIEFHGDSIDGNIQSTKYTDHNIVKIDMVKQDNKYSLNEFKNNIKSILKYNNTNIKYFEYIKVKVEDNNITNSYTKIIQCLEDIGDNNVKTNTLENGCTSTTYTGKYNKIYSAGEPIDFNFAIVHYSTGTYIIMGTPEIIETY